MVVVVDSPPPAPAAGFGVFAVGLALGCALGAALAFPWPVGAIPEPDHG